MAVSTSPVKSPMGNYSIKQTRTVALTVRVCDRNPGREVIESLLENPPTATFFDLRRKPVID